MGVDASTPTSTRACSANVEPQLARGKDVVVREVVCECKDAHVRRANAADARSTRARARSHMHVLISTEI